MPCASNAAIVCASQPSSRWANQVSPHSTSSSSPHSASSRARASARGAPRPCSGVRAVAAAEQARFAAGASCAGRPARTGRPASPPSRRARATTRARPRRRRLRRSPRCACAEASGDRPDGGPGRPRARGDTQRLQTPCLLTTCALVRALVLAFLIALGVARRRGRRDVRRVRGGPPAAGRAQRRSGGARARARGRLDPRQRDRRARRDRAAAPGRAAARGAALAGRGRRTPTACVTARARTPAASTSTATSRSAGPAAGGRSTRTSPAAPAPASRRRARCSGWSREVEPDLTVYYHQHMRLVVLPRGAGHGPVRAYARRVGLPARRLPAYRGTATSWQNHRSPGTTAFVVELPAGRLSRRAARRHARAVLAVAPAATTAAAPKPPIEWDPIPFGAERKRQMRRYSLRHYGEARARLVEPKVIVAALHRVEQLQLGVRDVRLKRARRRVRRATRRLRPLPDRPRRRDPPARLAALALPPHGRPERQRDRDRARRRLGRRRDGAPAPARRLAAADALAPGVASASSPAT